MSGTNVQKALRGTVIEGNVIRGVQGGSGLDEATIIGQIAARSSAKVAKNFAEADRIRQALSAHGVELRDSANGTTWVAGLTVPKHSTAGLLSWADVRVWLACFALGFAAADFARAVHSLLPA